MTLLISLILLILLIRLILLILLILTTVFQRVLAHATSVLFKQSGSFRLASDASAPFVGTIFGKDICTLHPLNVSAYLFGPSVLASYSRVNSFHLNKQKKKVGAHRESENKNDIFDPSYTGS